MLVKVVCTGNLSLISNHSFLKRSSQILKSVTVYTYNLVLVLIRMAIVIWFHKFERWELGCCWWSETRSQSLSVSDSHQPSSIDDRPPRMWSLSRIIPKPASYSYSYSDRLVCLTREADESTVALGVLRVRGGGWSLSKDEWFDISEDLGSDSVVAR